MDLLIRKLLTIPKQKVKELISIILFKVHPAFVFAILLILTIFWFSYLSDLEFNYDIERFFSNNDPKVSLYNKHKKTFENENDFVLIGIRNELGIFEQEFLQRIDLLSKELKEIPRINKVLSPTNLYETIKGPLAGIKVPTVHINDPGKYASDKRRIYESGIYVNSFFSHDSRSVSLLIKKDEDLIKAANDSILFAINKVLKSHGFDEFHLAGRIQTQHYYVNSMEKQMRLFTLLAGVLFFGALFIIFRCIKYVLISLVAVVMSLIWIFGIISWLEIRLDLMLTILPALTFIISTSGSIHLISRFRQEFHSTVPRKTAIEISISKTGLPNFLNSFTTAIGFASLIMIPVIPIQRFGLLVALGVFISFFIGILFVPTALKVMHIKPGKSIAHLNTEITKSKVLYAVFNKSKFVIGIFFLLVVSSIFFSFRLKIKNHFLDDLSSSSSLKSDLDFFEQNFSGIRPFEINISPLKEGTLLTYEGLLEMELVENYLRSDYKVGFLFSPLHIIKSINKSIHGGDKAYYQIPKSQYELNKILKLAQKRSVWNRFLPVLSGDRRSGRISGRITDEGSQVFNERNAALTNFLKQQTRHLNFQVTGAAQLMDNANSHIAWNLIKGIMLAVVISTLVIGLFTSSWKLALISLIPNLLPLLLVAGFMGAADISLKVATSLIFTITYGIAVDDTIHFLNCYRLNKKSHSNPIIVVNQTLASMWRPMLFTSFVLLCGFMIFTFSEFPSIAMLGLLVSAALLMALFADLILLPLVLLYLPVRE